RAEDQTAPPIEPEPPAPAAPTAPRAPEPLQPAPALSPFTGQLDLDAGQFAFLGGMPLNLSDRPAPTPPAPPAQTPVPPHAPAKTATSTSSVGRPAHRLPPRPRLPSTADQVGANTILPGLDTDFSSSPSVEVF